MLNWDGEVIFLSAKPYGENGVIASKWDYYYLPWEIEAYGLEVGLTWYFKTKYGIK